MTTAEGVYAVLVVFPDAKIVQSTEAVKDAVVKLAIRRQNASRGAERPIDGGAKLCRPSALTSAHGAEANRDQPRDEATPAQDTDSSFEWPEAV